MAKGTNLGWDARRGLVLCQLVLEGAAAEPQIQIECLSASGPRFEKVLEVAEAAGSIGLEEQQPQRNRQVFPAGGFEKDEAEEAEEAAADAGIRLGPEEGSGLVKVEAAAVLGVAVVVANPQEIVLALVQRSLPTISGYASCSNRSLRYLHQASVVADAPKLRFRWEF